MDHSSHTFNYEMPVTPEIANPKMVNGLATISERAWMNNDEIVTGVKLAWNETESGNRKLVFNAVDWENQYGGKDGIEVALPDGGKRIFNLPDGEAKKKGPQKFEMIFPVKAGKNEVTIRIVSIAKHYRFSFDYITLTQTDATADSSPVLKSSFQAFSNIYHPEQKPELTIMAYNLPEEKGLLTYTVSNAFGKQIVNGQAELKKSAVKITLPATEKGYFKVNYQLGKTVGSTSYVVIEPAIREYIDDSRFGCDAVETDGYRLRDWPEMSDRLTQRSFLAGAKWVRHHSIHWFLREPEKGKYDWNNFDRRLEKVEQYKMRMLLTVSGTPKWASASDSMKMTVCGTYYYQNYPPKTWKDFSDYITTLVTRYHKRIKWYELGNEPGYTSAFWCNGSAPDFGMYLKTGYEAAKKVDQNCVILSGAPLSTDFFDDVVKSVGGKLYFDVMSVHYLENEKQGGARLAQWKKTLAKLGGSKIPLINSEEMGWKNDGTPLGLANALIKTYTREAALGIEKTFAFDFFRDDSCFGVSAFDIFGNPLPQYAAYRTMTHRLERAKFVADLSTGEYEAYLFDRQGTAVIVLWSKTPQTISLPIGNGAARLIDIMDSESSLNVNDGLGEVNLSPVPIFIEGGDLAFLTCIGDLRKKFPTELTGCPGTMLKYSLNMDSTNTELKLTLPAGWNGDIDRHGMQLTIPVNANEGAYDATLTLKNRGQKLSMSFLINVSNGTPGANLITNGDFRNDTSYWFFPKEKEKFAVEKNAGVDGKPAARTRGPVFFGIARQLKVRPGEKYVLFTEAKGKGHFGGVYAISDKNGKTIFPTREGINCLTGKLDNEWRKYSEIITIDQPEAVTLGFAMLANHDDKENREAFFNQIAIVRLTDKFTLAKVVNQGVCVKGLNPPADWNTITPMNAFGRSNVIESDGVQWSGYNDLGATCRMAMDEKNLYLKFSVKDNVHVPVPTGVGIDDAWKYDSIQLAFDPTLEGKDRTEIIIASDVSGKVQAYKHANFWTPELPENITRRGAMKDVKVVVTPIAGGMEYQINIPLNELYPLTKETREFGFSWLVNDNDGKGRKYLQWSSGIGGDKDASQFGLIKCVFP